MDIYSFINSKAISSYLREIGYKFDSKEAAWLIYQCKTIAIDEKHNAWRQLMQEMSDCELEGRPNCNQRNSLYELIKEYISISEKQYEIFKDQENKAVYQYRFYCFNDCDWCEDFTGVYGSLEDCWEEIDKDQDLGIEIVQICKRYIDSNKTIIVTYKADRTVMDLDSNNMSEEEFKVIGQSFEGMWFDFPVPFQKGDILIENRMPGPRSLYAESGPFVMIGITPWESEQNRRIKEYGDNSDMNAWGYFQDNDGRIFHEVMFNYMDLDYYEGPFEDSKRLLVALSSFIKDKIGVDLLLTSYRKIIMDEIADDVMLHGWYSEEGLKLAGLSEVVTGNNRRLIDSGLNPNTKFYTDTLACKYDWDKNQELYAKCHEIASNYGQPKEMLFVYGKHGCGKTTILQCLGNLSMQLSRRNLLYITAENFVTEVIDAIRHDKLSELRQKFRKLDFLIFEDIQMICGKEATTEEFMHTLNDLLTAGAQVVVSADRPIENLDIPDVLKSKLSFATQFRMN